MRYNGDPPSPAPPWLGGCSASMASSIRCTRARSRRTRGTGSAPAPYVSRLVTVSYVSKGQRTQPYRDTRVGASASDRARLPCTNTCTKTWYGLATYRSCCVLGCYARAPSPLSSTTVIGAAAPPPPCCSGACTRRWPRSVVSAACSAGWAWHVHSKHAVSTP